MPASSMLTISDGTTIVNVPSCSMFSGSFGQADVLTGNGVIEYADGSAQRWIRFEARSLSITGAGPVPHGLWALDLSVPVWTVTYPSFDNDGTTSQEQYVPARPVDTRDINSGRTSWGLTLRAASAV